MAENPGDAITLSASTTCSGLTLGTPVCHPLASSDTLTVQGGTSKTCTVTATAGIGMSGLMGGDTTLEGLSRFV